MNDYNNLTDNLNNTFNNTFNSIYVDSNIYKNYLSVDGQEILEKKTDIKDLKILIENELKHDFKNIDYIYSNLEKINSLLKEIEKIETNSISTNKQTTTTITNTNHTTTTNPFIITTTPINTSLNYYPYLNKDEESDEFANVINTVIITALNSYTEEVTYEVIDDVFKSEFNNYYLKTVKNKIISLKRVIDIKPDNNESLLKIWFDNKNKNFVRNQKLKEIIEP